MRLVLAVFLACAIVLLFAQAPPVPPAYAPTADELVQIDAKTKALQAAIQGLRPTVPDELLVDVEVYLKAVQWVRRFGEFYSKTSVAQTLAIADTGLQRAKELADQSPGWTTQSGSFCRAYRSRVDGSIQPYAVTIPDSYNGTHPMWLEVILHGRGATLTEVSFLHSHDRLKPPPANHEFIQLDVFGRANVAYRWAGETDVFEAIESVKKRYKIDADHTVLRGFSMGGAGAWHLGLHYPDRWAAVEAGAGFVETKVHGNVPDPPRYTRIYDALDYALNAINVPVVGYGGEDDPQLRASVFIRKALEEAGYEFESFGLNHRNEKMRWLFLVGPKTQHKWHPESKDLSDSFMLLHQSPGIMESGDYFVTYTERYNENFGTTIDQLETPYEMATFEGEMGDDYVYKVETKNVSRLTLHGEPPLAHFLIDGQKFPLAPKFSLQKVQGKWVKYNGIFSGKQHGLQGPIDDAFTESFVCVKPSAESSSAVNRYALAELERFGNEFARWLRGDIRVKLDRELTPADVRSANIIAFGTPETNPVIQKALAKLPVRWTRDAIWVGKRKFDAAGHILSLIYPNPDNPKKYLVLNSGHTFHEADFKGTNALLYPRVGDWAVTNIQTGSVVAEGIFDRNWQLPANQ